MQERSTFFLEQFDSNYRNHIIEFSKQMTEASKEYDVLIFLARKAACLADCLETLEMSQFHCIVTSSRVLDMNLEWMVGKRVALVDDALITGSTINRAINKLLVSDVKNVEVIVLSVDENWWAEELVKPMQSFLTLSSEQTSLICSNIVRGISVVPRPYTIDYPLYKNIDIYEDDFSYISNLGNWIVYESTSSHQAKYDITNLTIVPTIPTLLDFLSNVGLEINNDSLFKIRLYALKNENVYSCQLLPIVILPAMKDTVLDALFNQICYHADTPELASWFNTSRREDSLKSKLRFVQYYLGSVFGQYWHTDFQSKIEYPIVFQQDFRNTNFLFPPPISDLITKISKTKGVNFSKLDIVFENQTDENNAQTNDALFDEMAAIKKLSKPFLELYQNDEREARELFKKHGMETFKMEEYKDKIDRLNRGYSIGDLKEKLTGISEHISLRKLVSYFLDLHIDRGAVVPITYVKDDLIVRAFRHGEDVEFSENEIRLCASMLAEFVENYGSNLIPHTIVEKLLVLFIRIGIEKNFLTISSHPIGEYNSVGIRFYLHGAVVGAFDKQLYKVNFDQSLTNILSEYGFLSRQQFEDPYTFDETHLPSTGIEIKGLRVANQIGLVMGELLKRNNAKISSDELILMSTCPYVIDIIGAMAAEVSIFQNFFHFEHGRFFPEYKHNNLKKFSEIRSKKAFTAINSGTWKFVNFKDGTPWKIIDKAENSFDNKLYREVWKEFWPYTGKETSLDTANPNLISVIEQLASNLFKTRFYINLVEVSLSKNFESFESSKSNRELINILNKLATYLPSEHKSLKIVYDGTHKRFKDGSLKKDILYKFSVDRLHECYHNCRQLLSEVDVIAADFGKIEKILYYENVLVIDYKNYNIPVEEIDQVFRDVINDINKSSEAEGVSQLFEIPLQYSSIKTGKWVCAQGPDARDRLAQLCNGLIQALDNHVTLKFCLFGQLDTFRIIRKANSNEYYAPLFWDIAKELLKSKYALEVGHEMIYFTTSQAVYEELDHIVANKLPEFERDESKNSSITIEHPYKIKFNSSHYTKSRSREIKNIMDIGILTIVAEELAAVTDYFEANGSLEEKQGKQSMRTYYHGLMQDKGGQSLKVVAGQALEQGNRSIITLYNEIAQEFNPDMMILIGIGGSIHKDVDICDVAICETTFYYDSRSETEQGIKRRLRPYKINAWTRELVRRYHHAQKSEEPSFGAAENSPNSTFTSFMGPLGTGEAVVKYKDSEVRQWLESVNDKTLALETEAAGAGQQFYEDELNYSRRSKGLLILRGISDRADRDKKDEWRLAAAKNAMTVLSEILKASNFN